MALSLPQLSRHMSRAARLQPEPGCSPSLGGGIGAAAWLHICSLGRARLQFTNLQPGSGFFSQAAAKRSQAAARLAAWRGLPLRGLQPGSDFCSLARASRARLQIWPQAAKSRARLQKICSLAAKTEPGCIAAWLHNSGCRASLISQLFWDQV